MNPARDMLNEMREDRDRRKHGSPDNRRRRDTGGGVIYVPQPYYPAPQPITIVAPPPPAAVIVREPVLIGFLNLDVEPRASLQIFVDDVFIGTPADQGDELRLAPGTRRIELRARGYKTLAFSAEIVADRSISYRGTLERDRNAPAPPSEPSRVASAPTTMYRIQGCYLGNVKPKASDLRAGCDISKMTTFTP